MTKNEKQPTNQEILQAINKFAEDVAIKDDIKAIRSEMATKSDIKAIRSEMATKSELKILEDKVDLIQLKMDNVPYRFELNDLTKKLEMIEAKI